MKEEWKDILQNSLADFEEAAPEGLWQDIEKNLPTKTVVNGKANDRKSSQRNARWISILACAACAACVVGFFIYNEKEDFKNVSEENHKQDKALTIEEKQLAENTDIHSATSRQGYREAIVVEKSSADIVPSLSTASQTDVVAVDNSAEDVHTTEAEHGVGEKTKSVVINNTHASNAYTASSSERKKENVGSHNVDTGTGKWSAALFAANSVSSGGQTTGMQLLSSSLSSDVAFSAALQENDSRVSGYYVKSSDDEHVNHHHPVRVGLSVRYSLTRHWGIETGLTYSYLSSDISQGEESNCNKTEQKLHFIGIPLNVDYTLWNNKVLNVYVSGGGMVEKNIKGNSTASYILNGKAQSVTDYKIKTNRLQWSANAAVGVQVNITKDIGLYAEPGIGYYFDNGSALKTYYSEKPLSFNLKLGLRYTINE